MGSDIRGICWRGKVKVVILLQIDTISTLANNKTGSMKSSCSSSDAGSVGSNSPSVKPMSKFGVAGSWVAKWALASCTSRHAKLRRQVISRPSLQSSAVALVAL